MARNSLFFLKDEDIKFVEKDPNFKKDLVEILSAGVTSEDALSQRGYSNGAFEVIWNEEVETTALVAVGQGSATVLGTAQIGHTEKELQIKLLKKIAKDFGYRLSKIKRK